MQVERAALCEYNTGPAPPPTGQNEDEVFPPLAAASWATGDDITCNPFASVDNYFLPPQLLLGPLLMRSRGTRLHHLIVISCPAVHSGIEEVMSC